MQALVALLVLTAAPPDLAPAELQAVLRGEVAARTEPFAGAGERAAGRGVGAVIINRPPAEVWATLSRFEDKAEYMPRVKAVDVLAREPRGSPPRLRVRMTVDASVTTARYTAWFDLDEAAGSIRWRLDRAAPDNTIADAQGDYRLFQPSPGRTLLVYRSYVDTGRRVPAFIQRYMAMRSIPTLLKAIKSRVESGGRWRP